MKMKPALSSQDSRSRRGRVSRRWLVGLCLVTVFGGVAFWRGYAPVSPGLPESQRVISAVEPVTERRDSGGDRAVSQIDAASDNPRAAQIVFAGVRRVVVPNARGEFSRVGVPASAVIVATVPFPDSAPGSTVFLQAEDGGLLSGAASAGALVVGEDRRVTLEFRAAASDGIQRVTLRDGAETRLLEFWVGPEAPGLVRNTE